MCLTAVALLAFPFTHCYSLAAERSRNDTWSLGMCTICRFLATNAAGALDGLAWDQFGDKKGTREETLMDMGSAPVHLVLLQIHFAFIATDRPHNADKGGYLRRGQGR